VFECESTEFRGKVLKNSSIADTLIHLAKTPNFEHASSSRAIRHGYMALVTKLGNLIQKFKENPEVSKYLNSLPNQDEWKQFVEGELKRSNETNNKNLGGQQPRSSMDEDDDSKDYEMNMEKIMAKFSNFNTGMSNKSNNDDDEEEEEETEINKN